MAKGLAREAGLSSEALAALVGSGPQARIVAEDVRRAVATNATQGSARAGAVPPAGGAGGAGTAGAVPPAGGAGTAPKASGAVDPFSPQALADALERPYTITPLSGVRRAIATRLTESKQRIPHYYLYANCRVDALVELRGTLNRANEGKFKLSLNDFIVRALALALRDEPQANCAYDANGIVQWGSVDLSIAVATEDGLFTPVVRDADTLSLPEISKAVRELAGRARKGKLKPQEYLGGCFTLSNLGMFGVSDFTAVINPPQSGILAVGAAEASAVVGADGRLEVGKVLRIALSLDHRAVDGAVGAQLLRRIRGLLEQPLLLAL